MAIFIFVVTFLLICIGYLGNSLAEALRDAHYYRGAFERSCKRYDELAREFDARAKIDSETRRQVRRIEGAVQAILKPIQAGKVEVTNGSQ